MNTWLPPVRDGDPLDEVVRSMPKAEVHIHLEDVFEVDDVVRLASDAGEPLLRPPARLFEFDNIGDLLAFYDWACGLVRTREQLARLAYRFSARQTSSGVLYSDLLVSPIHWEHWRHRLDAMVDAIDAGLSEAEQDGLPRVGLCVSLSRKNSKEEAADIVDWLVERSHPRVVALSIDGNESGVGPTGARFADAFARAGAAGLRRTVHAGETSGPEGVRDAIDFLRPDRIDHGVRAIEDDALVAELAASGIPLTICPRSNITLGMYPDRASHPLGALLLAGVRVTIGSDSYLMGCQLVEEYVQSARAYGWTMEVLRVLARNSIDIAFCDDDMRRQLLGSLEAWDAPT